MKTAIVLFNLGGPDSLDAVKPFLYNLFSDKAIIGAPTPIRQMLAALISSRRAPIARDIYSQMGGSSPILPETEKQAEVLGKFLKDSRGLAESKVFIAMRYWHPFVEEAIVKVEKYEPDQIILLPLYPQFSTTTTGSSFNSWWKGTTKTDLADIPTYTICCYPSESGLINAQVDLIESAIKSSKITNFRLLLSAHGLPKKIIEKGDPYQKQIEKTAAIIAEKINYPNLDWRVSYQSRVGPLEWIGPSTETEISNAGIEKKSLIVAPVAFVSEHSETLVELDIEYRELADESGVPEYIRVPAVSTHPSFISGLTDILEKTITSIGQEKIREKRGPGGVKLFCPFCPYKHQGCVSIHDKMTND